MAFVGMNAYAIGRDGFGIEADIPPPRIISPSSDIVEVASSGVLLRWSIHESLDKGTFHYDIRVYKGSQRIMDERVYKTDVPAGERQVYLPADIFDGGGVFTIALRRVYKRLGPARFSTVTFTAVTVDKEGGSDDN
jgi:hypothetical protein